MARSHRAMRTLSFLVAALGAAEEAVPVHAAPGSSYALVADAGSTGTRVYLFHLNTSGGDGKVEVTDLGKGKALSSFQSAPAQAAQAVQPQLEKAKGLIPKSVQKSVPVRIYATAGMRLVPQDAQDAIYKGIQESLINAEFTFDRSSLKLRTISGREEGIFALIAANYLAKNLHASLEAAGESLMGVLDLGGSSTQVAAPPVLGSGEPLVPKLGSEHTFVRSFLKLGMERMRQRTFQGFVDLAPASLQARRAVPNPCAFYGHAEAGEVWRGTGHAPACEEAVAGLLREEKKTCSAARKAECLGEAPRGTRFFLISGYLYVTDFARWFLARPGAAPAPALGPDGFVSPTVAELREAAAALCAEPWERLSAAALDPQSRHRFTQPPKVPHRCFEINYIAALLSTGYGFGPDDRAFRIVEDIDGSEIEWTLGAFLHHVATQRRKEEEL